MTFIYFECCVTNLEGTKEKNKNTLQAAANNPVNHYGDLMINASQKMEEGALISFYMVVECQSQKPCFCQQKSQIYPRSLCRISDSR